MTKNYTFLGSPDPSSAVVRDWEMPEWRARGEALAKYQEERSDVRKREAARHGPRASELADLEHRAKLAEIRLKSIADFGITEGRTMTPAEGYAFDEVMLEIGQLKRQIADILR